MIELRQISAGYGKKVALSDLSLSFSKGELTVIVGPNGSGKSTLLKALTGILPLSGGEIWLDGKACDKLSPVERARRIAYLPQEKQMPHVTVEQLVLYGRYPHLSFPRRYQEKDREIARAAMQAMHLTSLANRPLSTLSGGLRQKAYLAMALAQSTDYVLLDEPTTYLDISHQLELMELLRNMTRDGKGVVAVMHDLPMAFSVANRVVVLEKGQVCAWDVPENLCETATIREIFGVELIPYRQKEEEKASYLLRYPMKRAENLEDEKGT